jgi:small subunit ribosomal protein S4
MRQIGPKNRIARREGIDLGFKTLGSKSHALLLKKMNIAPGQHGAKNRRKTTEWGRQLREKQKLRYLFGLSATQLSNYFAKAIKTKGNTAEILVTLLERRLDNVVYRLGFAPTRAAARQLVNHGHVKVNGKRVDIPSYMVKEGEIITFASEKAAKIPAIDAALSRTDYIMPAWLERSKDQGTVVAMPTTEDVEKMINMRLVIEFYSK